MKQKPINKPTSKIQPKKEVRTIPAPAGVLDNYFEKYPLPIAIGLTALLILIIFFNFLTGNVFYLFKDIGSDTLNTFYPHFVYVGQYLRNEGFPLWSFAQGLGQNIQSISINDPFYLIVYVVDKESIPYAIIWMEILKLLLTAWIIFHVLRMWNLKPITIIIGTILFTFSSFMIVGSGWYIFSTEVCFFALMLLGFEKIWQEKNWYLFPLAVALIAIQQPFNLFLYGLFLILYMIFRFFISDPRPVKDYWITVLRLTGSLILGLLISSFFLWASIQVLLDSPRVGGSSGLFDELLGAPVFGFADLQQNVTAIMRFFSSDLMGHGDAYKGWHNYLEAPLFYIGLLPLILIPQVFARAGKRKSIIYGASLFIMLFPVVFPFFRYAWWLFTGDYYRGFSFFVGLTILFLSLMALNEILSDKKINLLLLAGMLVFLLVMLFIPFPNDSLIVEKDVRSVVLNFLIIYSIILGLSTLRGFKPWFGIVLLFFVFIEMAWFNYSNLENRSTLSSREHTEKKGYNDYSVESSGFVNSIDHSFFRVNKTFFSSPAIHASYNDAKAQGYYSSPVYGSFNQKYYVRFLEETGIIQQGSEMQSRWITGLIRKPLLQNLVSTKYVFAKGNLQMFTPFGYDSINMFGDVKVLRNKYYLPLGFVYNHYIPLDTFNLASSIQKDYLLQKAFVAEQPVDPRFKNLKTLSIRDTVAAYQFTDYYRDAGRLKRDTLALSHFSQNHLKGHIELDSAGLLFFSIPYDKGWHAKVNGVNTDPLLCNVGFLGLYLDPGKYDIELNFIPPFHRLTQILTLAGILIYLGLILAHKITGKKIKQHVAD